jgi:PAS domain S-box-containing protein
MTSRETKSPRRRAEKSGAAKTEISDDSREPHATAPAGEGSRRETQGVVDALRAANRKLEAIIAASPLAVVTLDEEGHVESWNAAAERIFGWREVEVLGEPLPTVPAELREEVARNHADAVAGKAFANFETRRLRKDGTLVDVSISTAPLTDAAGKSRGVVALVADVTERKRAEEALRVSETRFRTLVEQSPLSKQILSTDGRAVEVNRAWEKLWGVTLAQLPDYNILEDEQLAAKGVTPYIRRAFAGEAVEIPEIGYVPDRGEFAGQERWVRARAYPVKGAGGEVREVVLVHEDVTERRRSEDEKLRLAARVEGERRRLRELVANVPGIVWEAWGVPDEASQRIDFVSDHVEQMLGYTVEEWLTTPNFWLTIVHPEDRERAAREARAKFDSREGGASRFRWVTKDGREIEVEAQSVVVCGERGEPAGMRGVTMDISERVRSEEALRQSEERYRAFVAQSSEAIWRFELDVPLPTDLPEDEQIDHFYAYAHLAECNDVMARMYGFARALDLSGARLQEMIPRNEANVAYLRAAIRSGYRMTDAESEERDRDGNTKYFLNNLVGIVEGGALRRVWGTQRDITGRRRAEEEEKFLGDATTILASSLDYEATLDAVAHMSAIYLADYCLVDLLEDDGAIRRLVAAHRDPAREAAWREMQRRFPVDADPRHTVNKVLHTGEPDLFTEMTGEALTRAIPSPAQVEELKRLGVRSAMTVPLRARGRTVGAISFISAESGRRYRGHELRLAEELARRAALAVDNARLYERAQEANRAKDEFLATLSHELRTPLTPIVGWVHLLGGDAAATPDLRHGLAVIDKNSQALSHLINDLLDMSAILNGKMRIDRLPVKINSVLREAVETVRAQADKRGIVIGFVPCEGDEPQVEGDRTRLVQVFWNLLSNAVKFSPDGGRVRVACDIDGRGFLRARVEDWGVGISPEFLPHVFERFRQADMSPTKLYGGLGIGLSLVRSFVEAHGGEVAAESAGEGRGSRFTVSLPLRNADCGLRIEEDARPVEEEGAPAAEAEVAARQPNAPNAPADQILDTTGRESENPQSAFRIPQSARVLIVEDAPDTLEMLRLFLAARGFAPTACASASEALDVAARQHFDIIVTDIGLPNIDGYELLRRLRSESPHLATAPAIALTGYAAEADVAAARDAGFEAHVAKPFEPETLGEAVAKLLATREPDGVDAAPR